MDVNFLQTIIRTILESEYIMTTYYDTNESYFWKNSSDLLMIAANFQKIPNVFKIQRDFQRFIKKIQNLEEKGKIRHEHQNSLTTKDSVKALKG